MPMLNPFSTNAFNLVSLTQAINLLPNNYGKIREANIFPGKGVRNRTVIIEEQNGILTLLPTMPPGSPGTQNKMGKRKVRSLTIPHIPHDDVILPDEYEGIRAFGSETQTKTYAKVMNDHLQSMRNKHAITLEHLRMGALKGVILDADSTVLYDLYEVFEIVQKKISFALGTSTTNVRGKCLSVLRHIDDNLMGEVATGAHAYCSATFLDALVSHAKVEDVFKYHQAAVDRLGGDPRKGFEFGGIMFEEYRGKATNAAGDILQFIKDGEAHVFPTGTMSTFSTIFAPADFLEAANTLGKEIYAKKEARKFNRGIDLHTQSNPLPLCARPGVLVKLTA